VGQREEALEGRISARGAAAGGERKRPHAPISVALPTAGGARAAVVRARPLFFLSPAASPSFQAAPVVAFDGDGELLDDPISDGSGDEAHGSMWEAVDDMGDED